jgi:hypothetical protein
MKNRALTPSNCCTALSTVTRRLLGSTDKGSTTSAWSLCNLVYEVRQEIVTRL